MPPPAATPPGGHYPDGFTFDRFGAQVPAVIVSPYIAPGSILRPPANGDGPGTPFDHTSIIKTAQELFDLGAPLTPRVAAAPSLLPLLGEAPINAGPSRIDYVPVPPLPVEVQRLRKFDRKSGSQLSMARFLATALGTVARISAHSRHGVKQTARRTRLGRRSRPG